MQESTINGLNNLKKYDAVFVDSSFISELKKNIPNNIYKICSAQHILYSPTVINSLTGLLREANSFFHNSGNCFTIADVPRELKNINQRLKIRARDFGGEKKNCLLTYCDVFERTIKTLNKRVLETTDNSDLIEKIITDMNSFCKTDYETRRTNRFLEKAVSKKRVEDAMTTDRKLFALAYAESLFGGLKTAILAHDNYMSAITNNLCSLLLHSDYHLPFEVQETVPDNYASLENAVFKIECPLGIARKHSEIKISPGIISLFEPYFKELTKRYNGQVISQRTPVSQTSSPSLSGDQYLPGNI